jgi:hypothetical protein
MLMYLFDFRKVFFEGASKSSTAFLQCIGGVFAASFIDPYYIYYLCKIWRHKSS